MVNEYQYKSLKNANTDLKTLYRVFSEAFSDYHVDISLSFEAFQSMLQRKGFSPELSFGAFKEPSGELVGFVLNGLRNWQGKTTAYDLGTGVIPPNRRQGITKELLSNVMDTFKINKIEQYLLEVLQENKGAYELYSQQGFQIVREFSVFSLDKSMIIKKPTKHIVVCGNAITPDEWDVLRQFWDYEPSWQNSIESVSSTSNEFNYVRAYSNNQLVGYGIVDKNTGDIPQLAVKKEHRGKGIARDILAELLINSDSKVFRFINVDCACLEMESFLVTLGFEQTANQYEMILPITFV